MIRGSITSVRPEILTIKESHHSTEMEGFQSKVLRPIAKYQNVIILKAFSRYLNKYKISLEGKSQKDKIEIITKAMKTNKELKCFYQGLMAGLMTDEEFDFYILHRSEVNRRMTTLLLERIVSQVAV